MTRIWKALFYSLSGLLSAWRDEPAFRQEIFLAIILIPASFYFAPDKISLILMISSVIFVLIVELINTSIEATVNRISTEIHPLAKKAKDTASAAVLFAVIQLIMVWIIILFL